MFNLFNVTIKKYIIKLLRYKKRQNFDITFFLRFFRVQ